MTPGDLADLMAAIHRELAEPLAGRSAARLVGVGGTVTSLAAVHLRLETYDSERVQGLVLGREAVGRLLDLFAARTIAARKEVVGLDPKRADVILAGTAIIHVLLERLRVEGLTVSDRGLRHALLYERFGVRGT